MGKVVDIESNLPHIVEELMCINCKFRYIGTRSIRVKLKNIVCPKCNQVGFIISTGELIEQDDYEE